MGYAQSFSSLFPIPNCPSSPDPQVMIAEALEAIEFVGKSACLKLKQVLKLNCEGGRVVCVSVSLFFFFYSQLFVYMVLGGNASYFPLFIALERVGENCEPDSKICAWLILV